MSTLYTRISCLLIVMALFIPAFDFGIKDIKDQVIDTVLEEIPDLSLEEDDPITTSLDDAVTEIPFLDDFEPSYFLPMGELPRGPGGYFLLMPGAFEIEWESFCLHAGTHGPGQGDGYLYAPLEGPKASIIKHLMENSRFHWEIPQRDLQVLIWAILARTKISDMDPHMQQTAATLLTDDEVLELEGFALDTVKSELFERAFGELPPSVQRIMQAKAELRNSLTSGSYTYNQLENIAVLSGDAPWTEDSRDVPRGRWSFHPDGYFVRYFPHGYPTTRIQVSVPDLLTIGRDANGDIIFIEDAWGNSLEIIDVPTITTYSFTGSDPNNPREPISGTWTASSTPSGLSSWESNHRKEVRELCGDGEDVDEILALGKLAYEVKSATSGTAGKAAYTLVQQAWQDAVCEVMGVAGGISLEELSGDAGPVIPSGMGGLPGTYAFSFSKIGLFGMPVFDNLENMRRLRERDAEHERIFGKERENRMLKEFNPTGSVASPGNTGAQRLANGGRPKDDTGGDNPNGKKPNSYGQAQDVTKKFNYGFAGAKAVGGPIAGPGAGLSMSGFAIPMLGATVAVSKTTSIWDTCNKALGDDPPDPNFKEFAELDIPIFDPVVASDIVPQERADKFNVILDSSMNLTASFRAAIASLDKHGGATLAGDAEWIIRQAEAIVYYKRLSGIYMYDVADALLAYTEHLRGEGYGGIQITAESFEEYQDELRANGFSQDELDAMHVLDFTEDEIQESLSLILSANPNDMAGNFCLALDNLAWVLYAVGWDLYSNWDVKPPNDWEADWPG